MKRQGVPLDTSSQKKVNTGKDVPSSSSFNYGGLQKLKQQKLEMQQKIQQQQQKLQSSSSSQKPVASSSSFNYSALKDKLKSQNQKQSQQKEVQKDVEKDSKSSQQSSQSQKQKLYDEQSERYRQKKEQEKLLAQTAGKKLPASSSSSSSQTQKTAKEIMNEKLKLPTINLKGLNPEQIKLAKYYMKKQLQQQKIKEKIKKGEIKKEDLVRKPTYKEDSLKLDKSELKNVKMNEQGELLDENGLVIKNESYKSLKINKQSKTLDKYQQLVKSSKQLQGSSKYIFDSNVVTSTRKKQDKKKSHALHFIDRQNEEIKEEDLLQKIADGSILEQTEAEKQKKLESLQQQQKRVTIKVKHHDPIPNIEWWDQQLMKPDYITYTDKKNEVEQELENKKLFDNPEVHMKKIEEIDSVNVKEYNHFSEEKVHIYVEHPSKFQNNQANQEEVVIPFYLTKQERKKIRRKKRKDKEQDKQDKIKLGLLEPPKPKVKLSNMISVYGNEAYLDPSKVEADVKKQVLQRLEEHKKRNKDKKLTYEQRKDKELKKLKKDLNIETRIALFRIENFQDGLHRYKVDKNAQDMQMSGYCFISDYIGQPSLVVIQGGPKTIKLFKGLMLRRIKWDIPSSDKNTKEEEEENQDQIEEEPENNDNDNKDEQNQKKQAKQIKSYDLTGNKCHLVWEGTVKESQFNKWKVMELNNEMEAKKALAERGVSYYWDMVQNFKEEQ